MRIFLTFLAFAFIALPANAQIDFFAPQVYETDDSHHLVVADFNDDGHHDLLTSGNDSSGGASVLLGDGAGNFATSASFGGRSRYLPVGVADFDQDNVLDVVMINYYGDISVFPGLGNGTFLPPMVTATGEGYFNDLAVADFNNDNKADLAVTRGASSGDVHVFLGTGVGMFRNGIRTDTGGYTGDIHAGDFNEDGNMDVVLRAGNDGSVLAGDGMGSFTFLWGVVGSGAYAVDDFDRDNHLDVARVDSRLTIDYGDGMGGFTRVYVPNHVGKSRAMVCADFDLDGHNDFLFTIDDGSEVFCARGLGERTFIHLPLARPSGDTRPRAMVCADFDHDGEEDIVVGHQGFGSLRGTTTVSLNGSKHNGGCALGTTNMAMKYYVDTLFVNGSSGTDAQRRVVLRTDDPITITMSTPPSVGDGEGYFALYGYIGLPDESTTRVVPFNMGLACMSMPITTRGVKPTGYWNNTTLMGESGHRLDVSPKNPRPSTPAPSIVERRPGGVGQVVVGFLQGLIFDPNSAGDELGSVTNGIEVVIIE
jgi:hypothetical protein